LDHVIVLGEAHLRRILNSYADYYNSVRTTTSGFEFSVHTAVKRLGWHGVPPRPSCQPE